MKLILTHDVDGLGHTGDLVEVKGGYGRNFLLPRGLATPWTKGGEKQVLAMQKARKAREIANLDDAKALKQKLESKAVRLGMHAGPGGRLFGAVTTAHVADAVKEATGSSIDRRKVQVVNPIKTVGEHKVQIGLHEDVKATVTLNVVGE